MYLDLLLQQQQQQQQITVLSVSKLVHSVVTYISRISLLTDPVRDSSSASDLVIRAICVLYIPELLILYSFTTLHIEGLVETLLRNCYSYTVRVAYYEHPGDLKCVHNKETSY